MVPDIGGLRPLFDSMCARLAGEHGWVVVAPEPWPGREQLSLEERLTSVGTIADTEILGDCVAAADEAGVEPVAVMGFCMGGMVALKAASTLRFDKVVSFYGMVRLPEHWRSDRQDEPLDLLARAREVEVMSICGTVDPWVPEEHLDELEATGATVIRYEGADHGFVHDPDRPAHRPTDAADAWNRVTAFLSEGFSGPYGTVPPGS